MSTGSAPDAARTTSDGEGVGPQTEVGPSPAKAPPARTVPAKGNAGGGTHATSRPAATRSVASGAARERPLRLKIHSALRWLHTYISMFSLLAILFFSLTGVTLNHPEWSFNNQQSEKHITGKFAPNWRKGNQVNWLYVAETLREHGVRGRASDERFEADDQGSISFKAPGYSADCTIDPKTGAYEMTVIQQGLVGVMNDFHRGAESGVAWHRVIDLSGIFLTIVALTGLGLLYYLKKVRVAGFMAMGVGALLLWLFMKLAT